MRDDRQRQDNGRRMNGNAKGGNERQGNRGGEKAGCRADAFIRCNASEKPVLLHDDGAGIAVMCAFSFPLSLFSLPGESLSWLFLGQTFTCCNEGFLFFAVAAAPSLIPGRSFLPLWISGFSAFSLIIIFFFLLFSPLFDSKNTGQNLCSRSLHHPAPCIIPLLCSQTITTDESETRY